jgi:hypothetical protein
MKRKFPVADIFRTTLLCFIIAVNIHFFVVQFLQPNNQFSWQAQSFLHGQLNINNPKRQDMVVIGNRLYWPNGPFPAVFLAFFQLFAGSGFHQGYGQIVALGVLFFYLYKLTRLKGFSTYDSFFLLSAFSFGSVAIGLISEPSSWFFAQVVAMALLTCLLYEWETTRNYFILGVLEACIIATRPTAGLIGLYICWVLLKELRSKHHGTIHAVQFFAPVVLTVINLGLFNWARFGNPFDNGYFTNLVGPQSQALRQFGVFSLAHIPMNIYWYFLAGFNGVTNGSAHIVYPFIRYDRWGLSFFIVSPFFLYAVRTLKNHSKYRGLWNVIGLTLCVLLTYFTTGWYNFGPRYTADFLPLLYLLLLYALRKNRLNSFQKNLILVSSLLNTYLIFATKFT